MIQELKTKTKLKHFNHKTILQLGQQITLMDATISREMDC